jgi:hypothetical protein
MLVKLSQEMLAAIGGGANASEAQTNLSTFITNANQATKFMADSKVTLETVQASVTALEAKIGTPLTEARVKEIVGAETTTAIAAWSASVEGKKIIGAESSRIAMEALAGVGTQPAKPSPAGNPEPAAAAKTFAEIVQANMATGKKKSDAISAAVESNPTEYAAYLKTGGKL